MEHRLILVMPFLRQTTIEFNGEGVLVSLVKYFPEHLFDEHVHSALAEEKIVRIKELLFSEKVLKFLRSLSYSRNFQLAKLESFSSCLNFSFNWFETIKQNFLGASEYSPLGIWIRVGLIFTEEGSVLTRRVR